MSLFLLYNNLFGPEKKLDLSVIWFDQQAQISNTWFLKMEHHSVDWFRITWSLEWGWLLEDACSRGGHQQNISVAYFQAGASIFVIGFGLPMDAHIIYHQLIYPCQIGYKRIRYIDCKWNLLFFSCRSDYQQLVFSALSFKNCKIKVLKPCIMKPCELWSGKQVSTNVSLHGF